MRWRFGILVTLVGCIDTPSLHLHPTDGSIGEIGDAAAGSVEATPTLAIRDARGVPWPAAAAPRRPVLVVEPGVSAASEPLFLFEGEADGALLDDLERPPLLVTSQARRVPITVERVDGETRARPSMPLAPGASYVFAVGAWATLPDGTFVSRALALPLRVATQAAGAVLSESFPADGTSGVDPALPSAWVRFDDLAHGLESITLTRADGTVVPATASEVPCADVGFPDGTCGAIAPLAGLASLTRHVITIPPTVLDRGGAAIGPATLSFVTGNGAPPIVELLATACALDERLDAGVCVLGQDVVARIRGRASAPVRAFLDLADFRASTVSTRGDVELRIDGLAPSSSISGTLRLVDLSGRTCSFDVSVVTPPPLAPIVIDEIRSDPRGPEPAQEYVELWNAGTTALDLGGYRLSDRADLAGDVLPSPSVLAPGGRALIVADAFDPNRTDDAVVPAGVPLFRIGASLASSGLANSGEPLYLRDPSGQRVAEAPSVAAPGPGVCTVRQGGSARAPRPGDYAADPRGGCTPGMPTTP